MSTKSQEEPGGGSRQSRRWHDSEQYVTGKIDLEEFIKRTRAYETRYGSVMISLSRRSQKPA
jgi:hypothetical protein